MVEIQPKLPEKEIITPQPFDILVQVAKKPDGTATIIPLKESVQEVARWMDTYDRRMNISDYPYQSFGDVVICDGNMRPLSRLPLGLLNNYLRNKE